MTTEECQKRLTDLTSRYLTENARIWQRYAEGVGRAYEAALNGGDLPTQLGQFARGEAPAYAGDLLRHHLDFYTNLLSVNVDFTNRVLDTVFRPAASPQAAPTGPAQPGSPASARL